MLLEYDGSGFAGWARQPGCRSVQGVLEEALETVLRQPVGLTVAGRTDAGVHARGQVASFAGSPAPAHELNGVLPADVRVLTSEPADERFDARADAQSRTYRYRVLARPVMSPFERDRALHCRKLLDRPALEACARAAVGPHDFTAFTPTHGRHTHFEREVLRCEWLEEPGDVLALWIEADTFMRHMVRVLVGTMLAAASGRMSVGDFERLLVGRPRAEAGDTVGPQGLYLESVRY